MDDAKFVIRFGLFDAFRSILGWGTRCYLPLFLLTETDHLRLVHTSCSYKHDHDSC